MLKVAAVLAIIAITVLGALADICLRPCPFLHDPVCASNKKTYPNNCVLAIAMCKDNSIKLKHKGKCGEEIDRCAQTAPCTSLWSPICGTDQITYGMRKCQICNKCHFDKAVCKNPDLKIARDGSCEDKTKK